MSKGLEALEELGNETVATKDRNTIFMNGTSNNSYTHLTQVKNINKTRYETIEKELKTLEIIKKHKAAMNCYAGDKLLYSDYCICISHDDKDYQLLSEVLEE